jgi:hypothetical protein
LAAVVDLARQLALHGLLDHWVFDEVELIPVLQSHLSSLLLPSTLALLPPHSRLSFLHRLFDRCHRLGMLAEFLLPEGLGLFFLKTDPFGLNFLVVRPCSYIVLDVIVVGSEFLDVADNHLGENVVAGLPAVATTALKIAVVPRVHHQRIVACSFGRSDGLGCADFIHGGLAVARPQPLLPSETERTFLSQQLFLLKLGKDIAEIFGGDKRKFLLFCAVSHKLLEKVDFWLEQSFKEAESMSQILDGFTDHRTTQISLVFPSQLHVVLICHYQPDHQQLLALAPHLVVLLCLRLSLSAQVRETVCLLQGFEQQIHRTLQNQLGRLNMRTPLHGQKLAEQQLGFCVSEFTRRRAEGRSRDRCPVLHLPPVGIPPIELNCLDVVDETEVEVLQKLLGVPPNLTELIFPQHSLQFLQFDPLYTLLLLN